MQDLDGNLHSQDKKNVVKSTQGILNALALLISIVLTSERAVADLVFDISTDKATYRVGEQIQWSVEISITGSDDIAGNFGLNAVSLNLRDSAGSELLPGAINANIFGPAYFKNGGTYEADTQRLLDITAVVFQRSSSALNNVGTRSGILFATGLYEAQELGSHTLIGSVDPDINFNAYFDSATDEISSSPFSAIRFNNAAFSVNAIPEPSSFGILGMLGCGILVIRRNRAN